MSDASELGAAPNPVTNAGGDNPTEPVGNQAGNSAQITPQQPGESDIDYKKRYSDSTREFQKLKEEREKEAPLVKLGQAFADRYRTDAKFKKFVDEEWNRKSEEEPSDSGEGQSSNKKPVTPDPSQAWATQKMIEEQAHRASVYEKLEQGHTENLDKYNQILPNGQIYNPVRNSIGTLTSALMRDGMTFEKAAAIAFARVVTPEKAVNEAAIDGLVEGLTSNSMAYIGGGNARSKSDDGYEPTDEDMSILSKIGVDPKSDIFKKVAENKI